MSGPGGVTGDTVLNVMRGIRDAKDKKAEITERNRVARSSTKAVDISKQMMLGKATVDKIEAIEDHNKIVEAVGKRTKPSMAEMLVMYGNNTRAQTAKETFQLDCIVAFNASGVPNNSAVV